jgi:hypothetical protein
MLEAAVVVGEVVVTRSGEPRGEGEKIVDCIKRVKGAIDSFFAIVDNVKNVAAMVTSGELSSFEPSWEVLHLQ